jgi:hypothetical protein
MTEGASEYPIGQFLKRLMADHGFSRIELVQALGYHRRYTEKGLRRLSLWLDDGEGHGRILDQISSVFPAYTDGLDEAVAATKTIRNSEFEAAWLERCKAEEPTFVPYLYAEGEETVPSGICIFGVSGGHRRWTMIDIPSTMLELPLGEQLAALPRLMREYRRRYNGAVPFFGKLTGFKFARLLDYFQFDQDGVLIEHVERPFRCAPCSVELR